MDKARYIEPLSSGGELIVTADEWFVQFYFSGPDLRHNGQFVTIPSEKIDTYIEAFKENFLKLKNCRNQYPKGESLLSKAFAI